MGKEDVSMCNVSGFNINVPSTPASMSHASSKRTTGTTPRASLSKMRASLRGVNNNNNHPQGVRSGNRAQHSTIEEVDDEEHDGTTEPELDSEEDSEEEEQQENKVRKNRRENSERREGSEEEMIMNTMDSMDARASRLMEDAVSSYVARVEVERRLQRDVARLEEIGDERKEVEKEAELLRASLRQSMKRRRTSSTNPSTPNRNKLRESNDTSNANYNMNGRKKNNNNDRKERPESGARPTSSSGGRRDRLPIIQQRKRG